MQSCGLLEDLPPLVILPFAPRAAGIAVLSAGLLAAVAGDRQPAEAAAIQQFSTRTDLDEGYATVTDRQGRLVTDLTQQDFVVREEGQLQEVSTFAAGDQPVSLALAVDRSWSMAGEPLAAAQRAGRELLLELGDQDHVMLV